MVTNRSKAFHPRPSISPGRSHRGPSQPTLPAENKPTRPQIPPKLVASLAGRTHRTPGQKFAGAIRRALH